MARTKEAKMTTKGEGVYGPEVAIGHAGSGAVQRLKLRVVCAVASLLISALGQPRVCASGGPLVEPLSIDRQSGVARITVSDQAGLDYTLEGSDGLASKPWVPLRQWTATGQTAPWFDVESVGMPQRFYRLRQLPWTGGNQPVTDFRLLGLDGRSYELKYHKETAAIVLIMAGTDLSTVSSILPDLGQLKSQYGARGVLFWILLAAPDAEREQLLAQAQAAGIDLPVLLDPSEQVSREFSSGMAPEAVAVRSSDWTIIYRGAVADGLTGLPQPVVQNYLDDTLRAYLTNAPVTLHATAAKGSRVVLTAAGVADYAAVIAPLLHDKCVACHSPDNIAPFAMTNYDVVKAWSADMKAQVLAANMPPWHADPHYGSFVGDRSLTPLQLATLVQWIDAGTPRGAGPDPLTVVPPPPPKWPEALGEPDVVIRPASQSIKADGTEPYRYIYVQSTVPTNVWLRAAVVRPSNPKVVHHYLVWPGKSSVEQSTGLALYVPGREELAFPAETGVALAANSWLTFNLHYTPDGQEETDQPELGLYFAPQPPAKELKMAAILDVLFLIPPGAPDYEVTQEYTFNHAVTIYNLYPHMHLRGARMKYEVFYPDGQQETLLSVPRYLFHWQSVYRLATPKHLPAGSRVRVTGGYDNSPQNLDNPDPTQLVFWGDQSWDEMFIGYVDYTVD
jgi:hypothetical protein